MPIANKETKMIIAVFLVAIIFLLIVVVDDFDWIDLGFLFFIIGCFVRYIYIKRH